jgi:hypothetical protein
MSNNDGSRDRFWIIEYSLSTDMADLPRRLIVKLPDALRVDLCFVYSVEDVEVQYLGLNTNDLNLEQRNEVRFLDFLCLCL